MKRIIWILLALLILSILGYVLYKRFFGKNGSEEKASDQSGKGKIKVVATPIQLQQQDTAQGAPSSAYTRAYNPNKPFTYKNNPYWFPTNNPLVNLEYRLAEEGEI